MKKILLVVGILILYGIGSGELLACGDKFLVASRGTRYQRAGQARHGASILVYMHASSTIPKAFERVSEDVTKKAGYRVTRVENANRARSGAAPGRLGRASRRPRRQSRRAGPRAEQRA